MSNYNYNSIVSNQEAEALKEMIFKRARERAQAMADEVDNNYTTSVQNEIMDLARNAFVAQRNPFSIKTETKEASLEEEKKNEEIGFAKRRVKEFKNQITNRSNEIGSNIATNEIELVMADTRSSIGKNYSFVGALEFLNSQASIALVKNKGKTFEALA